MSATLHRWLLALLTGLKKVVHPSVCRHCHGSGIDEGFALGAHFSVPCAFCDAGAQEDARRVQLSSVSPS